MLPAPVTVDKGARGGGAAALPLAAIGCLCILLFLLAATIVLALIPVYLPKKDISNLSSTATKYFVLNPAQSVPAYGTASASACNTIANSISSSISSSSCAFAVSSSGRRRRSQYAYK
ncbi:unnamed protein product [Rotaria sp. Silwood2]|nr:unnamed protein product [Rotaria sp. Silwood2]CAF2877757.1 unnamed protein product [Rotaria sp. Silwood2]CAF3294328.1 unnamed protein product [Rotaria sp. Silwood2]CAF4015836.1 unnamed protein product [Rotaria sp. Silwood2]CAF4350995.1 unnamed protein product [Rotaria sp. Silwood2]